MCSVAVDFAKHGECVSKENYAAIQAQIDAYPDFMERTAKNTFQSGNVLGQLFRDLSCEEPL